MEKGKVLLDTAHFNLSLRRLTQQMLEYYDTFEDTCIIGIQPRGILLSNRLYQLLQAEEPEMQAKHGHLDITFQRDDFRLRSEPMQAYATNINFSIENKSVLLIDDVLYTGRTIQAALATLNQFGRPKEVRLCCLVNRRFNRHLPIWPDYEGIRVDALDEAYVKVQWKEDGQEDCVTFFEQKADE